MGHAVLDALRPELFNAQTIEAAAFHESFGDMSAILSALQVPTFRQVLLSDTSGKINRASRLSRVAEQLGAAIRSNHPDAVDADCLRNACNSFFYKDPQTLAPNAPSTQLSSEPHSFSRVFTGAFLEVLSAVFLLKGKATDPDSLLESSREMGEILANSVLSASIVPDYFSQVAAQMVQVAENAPFGGKYRDVLKSAFIRKGILSLQAASSLGALKRQNARSMTASIQSYTSKSGELPITSISAAQYGLKRSSIQVHSAEEPKKFGVTGSSLTTGPLESRAPHSAAEIYTEDIFKRGHVDVGEHAHPENGMTHPFTFKTHFISEKNGELRLVRRSFNCGWGCL